MIIDSFICIKSPHTELLAVLVSSGLRTHTWA